jgi:hypothetical protein
MASQEQLNEAMLREHLDAKRGELELHQSKLQSLKLEFGTLEDMAKSPEKLGESPQIADRLKELPSQIGKEQAAVDHSQIEIADAQKRLDLEANKPLPNPAGGPTLDNGYQEAQWHQANQAGAEHKKETSERIENIAHVEEALEQGGEHPPEPPPPPREESPTHSMQSTPSHQEVTASHDAHGVDPVLAGALAVGAIHAAGQGIARAYEKSAERKLEFAENMYQNHEKEIGDLKAQVKEQNERATEEMKKLGLSADAEREFNHNQFDAAAHQMNELYNSQKQQREDHGVDIPERTSEWQNKWAESSQALCEDRVKSEVEQRNQQMVQDYKQLQPDQAKVDAYQQQLGGGQSAQIQQEAQQLQQQTFPQMAPQGPALAGPSQALQQPQQPAMSGPGL